MKTRTIDGNVYESEDGVTYSPRARRATIAAAGSTRGYVKVNRADWDQAQRALLVQPVLLTALRDMVAYYEMGGLDGPHANVAGFAEYVAWARAAIAKVTP